MRNDARLRPVRGRLARGERPDLLRLPRRHPRPRAGRAVPRAAGARPRVSPRRGRVPDCRRATGPASLSSPARSTQPSAQTRRVGVRRDTESARDDATRTDRDRGWVESGDHATAGAASGRLRDRAGAGPGRDGCRLRAYQVALNRTVALKVIRSGGFATEAERAPVPERGRGGRAARPSPHRADLRGRREPGPALLQHEAGRGHQPRPAARRLQPTTSAPRPGWSRSSPRRCTTPISAGSSTAT